MPFPVATRDWKRCVSQSSSDVIARKVWKDEKGAEGQTASVESSFGTSLLYGIDSHATRNEVVESTHEAEHDTLRGVARCGLAGSHDAPLAQHFHQHVALVCHADRLEADFPEILLHRAIREVIEVAFRHEVE